MWISCMSIKRSKGWCCDVIGSNQPVLTWSAITVDTEKDRKEESTYKEFRLRITEAILKTTLTKWYQLFLTEESEFYSLGEGALGSQPCPFYQNSSASCTACLCILEF